SVISHACALFCLMLKSLQSVCIRTDLSTLDFATSPRRYDHFLIEPKLGLDLYQLVSSCKISFSESCVYNQGKNVSSSISSFRTFLAYTSLLSRYPSFTKPSVVRFMNKGSSLIDIDF